MSEIKVNSIKGVGASAAAISIDNSSGACTANITSVNGGSLGTKNLAINGAMRFNQYGNATGVSATGYYAANRMKFGCFTGSERYSVSTVADAPAASGFSKSFKIETTTADTSVNTGTYAQFTYSIEGYHLQHLLKGTSSAKPVTISFWVKGNTNYTPVAELKDNTNVRINVQTFNVTSSWTKVVLTYVGDTTGALADTGGGALSLNIWLKASAYYSGGTSPAQNTWVAQSNHNIRAALLTFDIGASTSNYFQITGLQIEEGSIATAFEFEPLGTTLARCQRYYYLHASQIGSAGSDSKPIMNAAQYTSTQTYGVIDFPVTMRTTPTLVQTSGTGYFRGYSNSGSNAFDSFTGTRLTPYCAEIRGDDCSRTAGHAVFVRTDNDTAQLAFSAEL